MRKGSPSINTRGSYEIWKVWKANRKNIGGKVMQLSRYVVLENNEHSSNFPSCDIGLFHSQLSLYVFVLLFFKKKKKSPDCTFLASAFFSSLLCPCTCFDLTSLMSLDWMKANHFLWAECFKGTHLFCVEFLSSLAVLSSLL